MDGEWLKNLASARHRDGRVGPADPAAVQRLAAARVESAIHELYDEAQDAALIYNDHAGPGRAINHMPLPASAAGKCDGFTLLMGRAQITLKYRQDRGHGLEASLTTLEGFARHTAPLFRFEPHLDPFGSLAWRLENSLLLNHELIIKKLFEALATHALKP